MKYVDTNILVRIITGDDRVLMVRAIDMIESHGKDDLFVDESVISELCFVLEFHIYRMKRADIHDAIIDILESPQFVCSKHTIPALILYKKHPKLDFTDCLLLIKSENDVATFDKEILKLIKA